MEIFIALLISAAVIAIIYFSGKGSKTIFTDPRSTFDFGPKEWLNNNSSISCPSCGNTDNAKNFFRQENEKFIFICPKCKQLFEIC